MTHDQKLKVLVTGALENTPAPISDAYMVINDAYGAFQTEFAPHIARADAYVVLPESDPFLTLSLLVRRQYDREDELHSVKNKPVIILDNKEFPNPYIALVRDLREKGAIRQSDDQLFTIAASVEEIQAILTEEFSTYTRPVGDGFHSQAEQVQDHYHIVDAVRSDSTKHKPTDRPKIAVFCSASTKNKQHLQLAYDVGKMIADLECDMVFGAANVSMMDKVAEGAHTHGAHVDGVTTPVFIGRELLEEKDAQYIDQVDVVPDIYVRMGKMFEKSNVLVSLPGGLGTAQETIAAFKGREENPDYENKKIVIVNDDGFWDQYIALLESAGYENGTHFHVVPDTEALETLLTSFKDDILTQSAQTTQHQQDNPPTMDIAAG